MGLGISLVNNQKILINEIFFSKCQKNGQPGSTMLDVIHHLSLLEFLVNSSDFKENAIQKFYEKLRHNFTRILTFLDILNGIFTALIFVPLPRPESIVNLPFIASTRSRIPTSPR